MDLPTSVKWISRIEIALGVFTLIMIGINFPISGANKGNFFSGSIFLYFIIAKALAMIIAGYYLSKGIKAAKITIMILSFLKLPAIPIGTIWGGIVLYLLSDEETSDFFSYKA